MSKSDEKCQYICSKCGYTTTHKGHYTKHLNKKNPCVNSSYD